jgi:hypothetical protein
MKLTPDGGAMILQLKGKFAIDNLNKYPAQTVQELRDLLTAGGEAHADPGRKNFYDVQNDSHVFFIYLAPKGNVLLLATWKRDKTHAIVQKKELVAQPSF